MSTSRPINMSNNDVIDLTDSPTTVSSSSSKNVHDNPGTNNFGSPTNTNNDSSTTDVARNLSSSSSFKKGDNPSTGHVDSPNSVMAVASPSTGNVGSPNSVMAVASPAVAVPPAAAAATTPSRKPQANSNKKKSATKSNNLTSNDSPSTDVTSNVTSTKARAVAVPPAAAAATTPARKPQASKKKKKSTTKSNNLTSNDSPSTDVTSNVTSIKARAVAVPPAAAAATTPARKPQASKKKKSTTKSNNLTSNDSPGTVVTSNVTSTKVPAVAVPPAAAAATASATVDVPVDILDALDTLLGIAEAKERVIRPASKVPVVLDKLNALGTAASKELAMGAIKSLSCCQSEDAAQFVFDNEGLSTIVYSIAHFGDQEEFLEAAVSILRNIVMQLKNKKASEKLLSFGFPTKLISRISRMSENPVWNQTRADGTLLLIQMAVFAENSFRVQFGTAEIVQFVMESMDAAWHAHSLHELPLIANFIMYSLLMSAIPEVKARLKTKRLGIFIKEKILPILADDDNFANPDVKSKVLKTSRWIAQNLEN